MRIVLIIRIYIDTQVHSYNTYTNKHVSHINLLSLHFPLTIWPGQLDITCGFKRALPCIENYPMHNI